MNYASQMNKLHSLIDHLKEQEKGYLDLLNSFSKFQQLTTNLFPMDAELNSSNSNSNSNPQMNQYQKDIFTLLIHFTVNLRNRPTWKPKRLENTQKNLF